MRKLLRIDTSPRKEDSHSRDLANRVEEKCKATHPDMDITYLDLSQIKLPHITQAYIEATFIPKEERSSEMHSTLALADKFIADIQSADTVLISVPMYNFNIPSALKAYIDYISRMGETFLMDEHGASGLLTGKKLIITAAYGADFSQMKAMDFVEPYLKSMFGFLGFEDITYKVIQGTSMLAPAVLQAKKEALFD